MSSAHMETVGKSGSLQVEKSILKAGQSIPDHSHTVPSSYVVVRGSGKLTGAKGHDVNAGQVVLVDAGQIHGWHAGSGELEIVGTFAGH